MSHEGTTRIKPKAVARPVERIITITNPGYEVVLFMHPKGGAEAVITQPGDQQPTLHNIPPPAPGRVIVVERHGTTLEVFYKDAPT